MYRLNKVADKNSRDLTNEEYAKCTQDTNVFNGSDCIEKMTSWLSEFKGKPRKLKYRNVEHNSQLIAQNGSGFDSWVVLNNLSKWYLFVKIIKNGESYILLEVFTRNVNLPGENKILSILQLHVEWFLISAV